MAGLLVILLTALVTGFDSSVENQPPVIKAFNLGVSERTATVTANIADPDGVLEEAIIDWGDGTQTTVSRGFTGISESHSYAHNGTYILKLTVTDDGGGAVFDAGAVTIPESGTGLSKVPTPLTPLITDVPLDPVPPATAGIIDEGRALFLGPLGCAVCHAIDFACIVGYVNDRHAKPLFQPKDFVEHGAPERIVETG